MSPHGKFILENCFELHGYLCVRSSDLSIFMDDSIDHYNFVDLTDYAEYLGITIKWILN